MTGVGSAAAGGRRGVWGSAWIAVMVCLLAGCATAPGVKPDLARSEALWATRESSLAHLDAWTLRGRIGVVADEQAWSASVLWEQAPSSYQIDIVGPVGQGRATVVGGPAGVSLAAEGRTDSARSPEALIRKHLGWDVPVSGLRYWLLGLPQPGPVQDRSLDGRGRLVSLDQAGWHIEFKRYRPSAAGVELPGKLSLETRRLRVRVAVQSWRVVPSAAGDGPAAKRQ